MHKLCFGPRAQLAPAPACLGLAACRLGLDERWAAPGPRPAGSWPQRLAALPPAAVRPSAAAPLAAAPRRVWCCSPPTHLLAKHRLQAASSSHCTSLCSNDTWNTRTERGNKSTTSTQTQITPPRHKESRLNLPCRCAAKRSCRSMKRFAKR